MWFRRKSYGWGWTPSSWQGWLVTFLFVCGILWAVQETGIGTADQEVGKFYLLLALLSFSLIVIAWRTGEPPRWQWGGKPI